MNNTNPNTKESKSMNIHFNIKKIAKGDRYGADNSLINTNGMMIEFYDSRYASKKSFGPLGQFITRYYVRTLLDHRDIREDVGLNLDGRIDDWTVSADQMRSVFITIDKWIDDEKKLGLIFESGDQVQILPEYQEEGDDQFRRYVVEGNENGEPRVLIRTVIPSMMMNPTERIDVGMIEHVQEG